MSNISRQEEEFLKKVYCKVNYLEYEKRQQKLIEENEKLIKKKKIKSGIILGSLALSSITVAFISNFAASAILVSSILLMITAAYYEFSLK